MVVSKLPSLANIAPDSRSKVWAFSLRLHWACNPYNFQGKALKQSRKDISKANASVKLAEWKEGFYII
jgi:hypothetical protein